MKIYQIVGTLNFGDAIGNDVIAIKHVIEDMGIKTAIISTAVSDKIKEKDVYTLEKAPKFHDDDIIIYHMGSGNPLNRMTADLNCRKIMIYHNITPYEFFNIDQPAASENCRQGLIDMRTYMKGKFTSYLADSEFNKSNMVDMGYKASEIEVIPVIVPFDDYKQAPDEKMVKRLSDGVTNIIFVGRLAPNKKQEDIIRAFAYYKEHVNSNSRLILVGSASQNGAYYPDLVSYVAKLGVQDVIFPGHISFAEILAIYKTAHVFLCMSEHEGFCVPLLEAMTFDVPIIAYDACAVPETMGGSGIVVDDKDPVFLSKVIDRLVKDENLRNSIISAQRERLKFFEYEKIKGQLQDYIRSFMDKYPPLSPDDNKKSYRSLYDIVDDNMKGAGKSMDFTPEALLACAERSSETIDITELLNKDMSVTSMIETVYISCFNSLPDKEGYVYWTGEAEKYGREEFIKRLVSSAVDSQDRKDKGTRILFNPFAHAELEAEAEGGVQPV
ncbi:MAG TPA: glycosyltransferase family 4 protein [Ruminococcus sp.]|nr:glycosyltransferase family 4 protein [Ruminococcus sp.]